MMKKVLAVVGIVVLLAAAFWGGTYFAGAGTPTGPGGFPAANGTMPAGGGPMGNLTQEEQAQLESMTNEERQAFIQEKMGADAPAGAVGGGMRGGGGAIEGEVIEVAADTMTLKTANGSSLTIYTDGDTVIGYAEGATKIAAGSNVMVIATPEADGVMLATGILVK